jgi:anti-anti-sigma regulatory factor
MGDDVADGFRVGLDGALTVRRASEIRDQLRAALRAHRSVQVDCSEVTEVDISFIQLMLAARTTALESGKSFSLSGAATGVLRETLVRGGFIATQGRPPTPHEDFWTSGGGSQ